MRHHLVNLYAHIYILFAVLLLMSCTSTSIPRNSQPNTNQAISSQKTVTIDKNFQIAMGQIVYVPVYSHIYHHNRQEIFNLAATLSIRNTDLKKPIIVTSVRFYDSEGKLVKQHLESPIQLDALASTDFFIKKNDTSGGSGANFIVEWVASTKVSEPIIEAIMIGTDSQQGISFTSPGKVIKNQN